VLSGPSLSFHFFYLFESSIQCQSNNARGYREHSGKWCYFQLVGVSLDHHQNQLQGMLGMGESNQIPLYYDLSCNEPNKPSQ
jgi:hypothetical protein